jgi:hypothetical protein
MLINNQDFNLMNCEWQYVIRHYNCAVLLIFINTCMYRNNELQNAFLIGTVRIFRFYKLFAKNCFFSLYQS